jgi:rhodanese-related sulfurtransferase
VIAQLLQYMTNHPLLAGFALAAAVAVLVYELRASAQNQNALSPQDAVRLLNQGATLLDVRPAEEFAAGHVRNARHLPMAQIADAGNALKKFKDKPVIVCCERGATSAAAIRQLTRQGFTRVCNLRGGLSAWRSESLPLVRD